MGRGYAGDVPIPRRLPDEQTGTEPHVVLIVDDNPKNLKLARDVLRAAGLRTLEATTGAEGITLAAEHLPDVILIDLRLPDMDGTDAVRTLGEAVETARIPVVALSALRADADWDWIAAADSPGSSRSRSASGSFQTRSAATAPAEGVLAPLSNASRLGRRICRLGVRWSHWTQARSVCEHRHVRASSARHAARRGGRPQCHCFLIAAVRAC